MTSMRCMDCGGDIPRGIGTGPKHRLSCRPPKVACASVRAKRLAELDAALAQERDQGGAV